MDAISFITTRSPVLGLNEKEENDMGEALFETVSNFTATALSVKAINFLAPWAGLIHTGSKIIWNRLAFMAQVKHKVQPPPNRNPFPSNETINREVYAPDPSLANFVS